MLISLTDSISCFHSENYTQFLFLACDSVTTKVDSRDTQKEFFYKECKANKNIYAFIDKLLLYLIYNLKH